MPGHLLAFCPSFARLSPKIKVYLRNKQADQQADYHHHDAARCSPGRECPVGQLQFWQLGPKVVSRGRERVQGGCSSQVMCENAPMSALG